MKTPPKKPHPDTARLNALIALYADVNGDFEQYLFDARIAPTTRARFRIALDQWIEDGRA